MRRLGWLLALILMAAPALAQQDFAAWRAELRAEALAAGISPATFDRAFVDVAPIPRIIELDRAQPERTITFEQYRTRVVTDGRARQGRQLMEANRALLDEVAAKYGVQKRFLVALWGIETSFGGYTGGFPVIASLATLAYDGRRSAYFRRELMEALAILEAGHIAPEDMNGSWAGAMGQAQFMPSTFRKFAQDHDGDGRIDIWGSKPDVFASAANYLAKVGWRDDLTWGREVRLPAGFDPAQADLAVVRRLPEWQTAGLRRADGSNLPTRDIPASVVLPDGNGGRAYVVYDNYRALLRWNRSFYFATSVGLLADRLAGG